MARRATEGFAGLREIKDVMDLYNSAYEPTEAYYVPDPDTAYQRGSGGMNIAAQGPMAEPRRRRPSTMRLAPYVMADDVPAYEQYDWENAYGRGVPAVGDLVSPDTFDEFVGQDRGMSMARDLPLTGLEDGLQVYAEPAGQPFRPGGRPRYDVSIFPDPPSWWRGGTEVGDGSGNWEYVFHSPTGLPLFPIPTGLIHPADEYGYYKYDPSTDMLMPDFRSVRGTEDDEFDTEVWHEPDRVTPTLDELRPGIESEMGRPMSDEEWEEFKEWVDRGSDTDVEEME